METVTGSVERITFYNPENGYSVIRLRPEKRRAAFPAPATDREGLLTAVGNLPELTPGEYVRLHGQFGTHPKHGQQFQIEICEQTLPATTAGIRRYLGSGLIKGIGKRMAERIVAHFGAETLEIIEKHPQRLREVADIGPKRTGMIAQAWREQKQIKEVMLALHSHGISTNLAVKIYKTYGDQALHIVQTNPYQLARDIYGVGFKTADKLAQALGLPTDHPSRIEAGIVYTLNELNNEGHVYVPQAELTDRAAALLEVAPELVPGALDRLAADDRVRADLLPFTGDGGQTQGAGGGQMQGAGGGQTHRPAPTAADPLGVAESPVGYGLPVIYPTPFYYGEVGVARRLGKLARAMPSRLSDLPPAFLPVDPSLSPEQQQAIHTALTHPVSVLTGGPGTGKTTCLKALIHLLETARKRYALCSPTGRAAKRLAEATGRAASTIHRLLDFSPTRGFVQNEDNPLPIDLLVVDEASMLDLLLANSLLKALEPGTHVLFVGDVDQLPSVGAGDVLRDVIASGIAPVTRLNVIFRQAADSQIITNAHLINQGKMPVFPKDSRDFFLFPAESAEEAGQWVVEVVAERIPRKFGLDPLHEVQVLAPMYRGPAGVHTLNERLQAALNPPSPAKPQKALFGQIYRVGDRVMQTQNDYDKSVFNGDIGVVIGLDPVDHTLTIVFDGTPILYDWTETDQLTLAYAISVHKSQGAEFPAVVAPVVTQHYMMLQRNLLYTAITRARRLCVVVGSRRALSMAVRNNEVARRHTALDWRLREGV